MNCNNNNANAEWKAKRFTKAKLQEHVRSKLESTRKILKSNKKQLKYKWFIHNVKKFPSFSIPHKIKKF